MRGQKFIKEQERNRLLEKSGYSILNGANLISVDVQPEYENGFTFDKYSFGQMINESFDQVNSLTFLFNGPDLGFPDLQEYQHWLWESCGIREEIVYDTRYFDKGYAFFRYCIDEGIEDEDIADLLKFMIQHNINDSREIDEEMWIRFMQEYNHDQSDVRDLLEYADDMIHIPDLMDYLSGYNQNIVLCGGGLQECLKEVEIALMAMDKPYRLFTQYCY